MDKDPRYGNVPKRVRLDLKCTHNTCPYLLLCYIKADRRYSKKWEVAAKRAFAHFPEIDTILQLIKEKDPSEIRTLMSLVADLALIVTTRQATRMFPPPAGFAYIFRCEHRIDGTLYSLQNLVNNFNFSGHGAFLFYKVFSSYPWKLSLNEGTDSVAKQVVYHSMFGTYKEDLGILSAITNHGRWDTREQMGKIFQKSNTQGRPTPFRPIQQILYSKLSQANQTGFLTSSYSQLSSIPCFSGKTKRKFDDAFFDHLSTDTTKSTGGRSMQSLISNYTTLRDELRAKLESNHRTLDVGTTGWKKVQDITSTLEPIEEVEVNLIGSGRFFLGKE